MLTWGEIDSLERQLKASVVALNKRRVSEVTLIEAVDDATLWPESFDDLAPIAPNGSLDNLIIRAPLVICAIASEIGFRFEGVGTVFWAKLSDALGVPIAVAQRAQIGRTFDGLATRYNLSRPSESAFSSHFSIISWPIANALLPVDLVGPVTRLMARAPVAALPGPSRAINLPSLRAWASSAEGARLTDWLRFEAPATRVLSALLTENRGGGLSQASYTRLRAAIATQPEAFFAARAAQLRARITKAPTSGEQMLGRLALAHSATGVQMFVTWPALPLALFDDARATARSAAWRPRLWGVGGFLHPDTALSAGPFALNLPAVPADDNPAYSGASEVFGAGSDAATALAARTVDWNANLLFDPNAERTQAEQRFDALTGTSGHIWVATKVGGATLNGLRKLGSVCGYTAFEANLADAADRSVLTREGLLSDESRTLLARHPVDAICAPQGVVRPDRPFLLYNEGDAVGSNSVPQRLALGARIAAVSGLSGRSGLRAELPLSAEDSVADLTVFERDSIFEALIERRLQLRVESRLPLVDVPVTAELEIGRRLIARGRDSLAALPMTVPGTSALLAPLYDDRVRAKLLGSGEGQLRIAIGRSIALDIILKRPAASVEWTDGAPRLIGADLDAELVRATAHHPHRFSPVTTIEMPNRGATAYGLRLSNGQIADPIQLCTSNIFDLSDLAAHFGDDVGSRRMFENGRGVGDIARARVAWARGLCTSLSGIAARTRIVRQFEEPLVIDLCGRPWSLAEQATRSDLSDPHEALWRVAVERGLAAIPQSATSAEAEVFARAFRRHARELDSSWPMAGGPPADGTMDDALNAAFSEAIAQLHANGALLDVDGDDFDFGSPAEDWDSAAADALRTIRRPALTQMIAPSEGGRHLSRRSYLDLSIAELAEGLSAWTRTWALSRGQLTPETAAGALQLWLSPGACNDVDAAVHVLVADPFVSRATRYAALRLAATIADTSA
jgi:hypothetical protein